MNSLRCRSLSAVPGSSPTKVGRCATPAPSPSRLGRTPQPRSRGGPRPRAVLGPLRMRDPIGEGPYAARPESPEGVTAAAAMVATGGNVGPYPASVLALDASTSRPFRAVSPMKVPKLDSDSPSTVAGSPVFARRRARVATTSAASPAGAFAVAGGATLWLPSRGPWGHAASPVVGLDADLALVLDAAAIHAEEKAIKDNLRATRASNVAAMMRAIMTAHRPVYRGGDRRRSRVPRRSLGSSVFEGSAAGSVTIPPAELPPDPEQEHLPKPMTPRRKFWLRQLFRWAVSRTIHLLREGHKRAQDEAKAQLELQRKTQRAEEEAAELASRRRACSTLFGNIAAKIKSGAYRRQVLTEARYKELKQLIANICGDGPDPVLSLAEITRLMGDEAGVDVVTFRKLDRDHSGYLDVDELLHGFYPSATARDIKNIRARVDGVGASRDVGKRAAVEAYKVLSAESMAAVRSMFNALDRGRRGVLSQADLEQACADREWAGFLNVRGHFGQSGNGFLTLNEFAEVVRFAFPPFNGHTDAPEGPQAGRVASAQVTTSRHLRAIPEFVLRIQEETTSSVD